MTTQILLILGAVIVSCLATIAGVFGVQRWRGTSTIKASASAVAHRDAMRARLEAARLARSARSAAADRVAAAEALTRAQVADKVQVGSLGEHLVRNNRGQVGQ